MKRNSELLFSAEAILSIIAAKYAVGEGISYIGFPGPRQPWWEFALKWPLATLNGLAGSRHLFEELCFLWLVYSTIVFLILRYVIGVMIQRRSARS
jgi:hypothetical protein